MTTIGNSPRPMRALRSKVLHMGSNNRVFKTTYQVRIVMSDGTDRYCDHTNGHTSSKALTDCANRMVRRLNEVAV